MRAESCTTEHARLRSLFSNEFSNELMMSHHCDKCATLANQMNTFRALVRVYGNISAVARQLNVFHTTVRSWKKKLEKGETLKLNVMARLDDLSPRENWARQLLFGFDGALYTLPALLAIHRCRTLGHLKINVMKYASSGQMSQGLRSGDIHLAVMSKTMWNMVAQDTATFTLVDIGDAPVHGISGRRITAWHDYNDMTVYVPAGTAVVYRVRERFDSLEVQPKEIKPIKETDFKTRLAMGSLAKSAFIGSPLWVESCFGGQRPLDLEEINPNFLPPTPAALVCNKGCPRAPLRLFLMSLNEVLSDLSKFLTSEDWDLGSQEANLELTNMVRFAREKDGLAKFRLRRDSSFFTAVSLWNAEVQALGRAFKNAV